jgi:hypothetical protein
MNARHRAQRPKRALHVKVDALLSWYVHAGRDLIYAGPRREQVDEIVPQGEFATWRAARAVGDYDLDTFVISADPVGTAGGSSPG